MNDMNSAFGAGKAGSAFDPIGYVMRPQVILRFICWLCSVIVFGCISAKGWVKEGKLEKCLYKDNNACRLGSGLGLIGFLASIALLIIEALFQNLSSVKIRRRVVAFDLGFSGLWAVLYALCFAYLGITWGKMASWPPYGEGINSCRAAIAFSFFSIFSWAGCAYFAYLRWTKGTDMTQFASGFENEDMPVGAGYSAYAGATEEPTYQDNPFINASQDQMMGSGVNYAAPTY